MQAFWVSKEHRSLEVESDYATYLHRQPKAAGLAFWVNRLEHGLTENQVIVGILTAPENRREHSVADSLIADLYNGILGRTPEPAELAYWEGIDAAPNLGSKAVIERILTSVEAEERDLDRTTCSTWAARPISEDIKCGYPPSRKRRSHRRRWRKPSCPVTSSTPT